MSPSYVEKHAGISAHSRDKFPTRAGSRNPTQQYARVSSSVASLYLYYYSHGIFGKTVRYSLTKLSVKTAPFY